ncbi:MAG: recombinase family protein [Bryobacteraceae bacterium]|nr:recombinase family protein [Bryobacteraceae bacterium]
MNVAIYARVSTKDRGQDCENQLRELRQFVERRSAEEWNLVGEYVDYASGGSSDREEFKKLFADAAERRFDLVLFWSLDRFSREGVLETLQHLQRLSSHGVDWFSLKEEYLRSVGIFREAVLSILATIAKQERIRLSERVKAGLDRARAQGKSLGRPGLVVDRQKIVELRRQGLPLWEIGQRLGISKSSVGRILEEQVLENAS